MFDIWGVVNDSTGRPVAGALVGDGSTGVTTDANGYYGFGSLPTGSTWKITETQPAGWLDGKDTAGIQQLGAGDIPSSGK